VAAIETNIRELTDLGISEREAKLYLVMLEYGEVTANEMHRLTGIQRSKIYSILSRMVVHGLSSERIEGRNRFFTALNPKIVKATLQREWDSEHANRVDKANSIFDTLEESFIAHQSGPSLQSIELIRNPGNIHNRFLQLINESKKDIVAFNRPPFAASTKKSIEVQNTAQLEAMERGVKIRAIIGLEDVKDRNFDYEKIHKNDLLRVTSHLPVKLFIFDIEKVFIGLPSNVQGSFNNFTMMYVDDPGFAELCNISFEEIWTNALPIEHLKGNEVTWAQNGND